MLETACGVTNHQQPGTSNQQPIDAPQQTPLRRDAGETLGGTSRRGARSALALIRAGFACLGWAALGLLCYGFALHTTSVETGRIYQWAAYLITYGGISFTLLRTYRKGEERGDW